MATRATLPDCYDYVRRTYGVPAYIGVRVRVRGRGEGTLVQVRGLGDHYLHIRLDGDTKPSGPYHPTDGIEFLDVAATKGPRS